MQMENSCVFSSSATFEFLIVQSALICINGNDNNDTYFLKWNETLHRSVLNYVFISVYWPECHLNSYMVLSHMSLVLPWHPPANEIVWFYLIEACEMHTCCKNYHCYYNGEYNHDGGRWFCRWGQRYDIDYFSWIPIRIQWWLMSCIIGTMSLTEAMKTFL